ncbi:MAG: SDR family oxidoreductase [Terriglobales bacterium]
MNQDTRIYIAGCGGMLGAAVYRQFSAVASVEATDIDVNESWLTFGDVRDYDAIRESVLNFRPALIVNLAAHTDMEYCERNAQDAWLTNAFGSENLAVVANELNVPYVYISTAGIFGGEKAEFNDYDDPLPLSVYAKSKYAGERFVREHVSRFYVVRAGWMMGGGPRKDKKFVNKIYKQLAAGARELFAVDDKAGTPSYTEDFARGLLALVQSGRYGVYNQVCEGSASRYDVAVELVRCLGLQDQVKVTPVSSEWFKSEYFAPRPASERLVCLKLRALGLYLMRHWKVSLAEYAGQFPPLCSAANATRTKGSAV